MNKKITDIVNRITDLEEELKEELLKEEKKGHYILEGRRVRFDEETMRRHREALVGLFRSLYEAPLLYMLTAPIIYSVFIPALLLDLWVMAYQAVNFRVYGIPRVKRRDYLVFDRHYLGYLNVIEKLNCVYCSYFNGLIAFVAEVAARTELFWCPIKHAKKVAYRHGYYHHFLDYGNQERFHEVLSDIRQNIAEKVEPGSG